MQKKKALVVGNWKMNPAAPGEARSLFADIKKQVRNSGSVAVVIAAPFVFLSELGKLAKSGGVGLGAQDAFYEPSGAFTGEVSTAMLSHLGVSHVIIGHSERRALGESDEQVNKKLQAAIKAKLTPILCIGESQRDSHGNFFSVIEEQLKTDLRGLSKAAVAKLAIAYEPIWAIGTGNNATAENVEEMKLFIQKTLATMYDRNLAKRVTILYGGSVNAQNCEELLAGSGVDGFLPGGASLRPAEFATIVKTVAKR